MRIGSIYQEPIRVLRQTLNNLDKCVEAHRESINTSEDSIGILKSQIDGYVKSIELLLERSNHE